MSEAHHEPLIDPLRKIDRQLLEAQSKGDIERVRELMATRNSIVSNRNSEVSNASRSRGGKPDYTTQQAWNGFHTRGGNHLSGIHPVESAQRLLSKIKPTSGR